MKGGPMAATLHFLGWDHMVRYFRQQHDAKVAAQAAVTRRGELLNRWFEEGREIARRRKDKALEQMRYEYQIETLEGRVLRIEQSTGQGVLAFTAFYLSVLNKDNQLRIRVYDEGADDPTQPVGVILLHR